MLQKYVIFEFFDKTHKSSDMRFFFRFQQSCVGKGGFVWVKALFCGLVQIQVVFRGIVLEKVDFCGGTWILAVLCGYRQICVGKGRILRGCAVEEVFSGVVGEKGDFCGDSRFQWFCVAKGGFLQDFVGKSGIRQGFADFSGGMRDLRDCILSWGLP